MERIAVVGAGGYVGRALLREFAERGIRVTAVVRGSPDLVVDAAEHDVLSSLAAAPDSSFDTVVNLAYPTAGALYEWPDQDAAIRKTVGALVGDRGRLIHASTLAVFGMALERPPAPVPVSYRRDYAYVESKIGAELAAVDLQRRRRLTLDVVRLGNVWGPASPNWVVTILHRLLEGRPVGVIGMQSPSNTTDVRNSASYLAHLATSPEHATVRYHHLAEFSTVPWSQWIETLAAAIGWEPIYIAPRQVGRRTTVAQEVGLASRLFRLRPFYRTLAKERVTGSILRSGVRHLPGGARKRLKGPGLIFARDQPLSQDDQALLAILSQPREFLSVLDPAWDPPVSRDASAAFVVEWLAANMLLPVADQGSDPMA